MENSSLTLWRETFEQGTPEQRVQALQQAVQGSSIPHLTHILGKGTTSEQLLALKSLFHIRPLEEIQNLVEMSHKLPRNVLNGETQSRDELELFMRWKAGVAFALYELGDLERGVEVARWVIERAPTGLSLARAKASHMLGAVATRERRYEAADEALSTAYNIYLALEQNALAARVLDTQGRMFQSQQKIFEAERLFRQSLFLKRELNDLEGQAITHGNLGRLAAFRGDYEVALEHFFADLKLAESLGDLHGQVVMHNQIGDIYLLLEEYDRASKAIESALEVARRSQNSLDLCYSQRTAGRLEMARHQFDTATKLLQESRDLFAKLQHNEEAARTDLTLGSLFRRQGKIAEAFQLLRSTLSFFRERNLAADEARVSLELSLVCKQAGKVEERRKLLEHGLKVTHGLSDASIRKTLEADYLALRAADTLEDSGLLPPQRLEEALEAMYDDNHGLGQVLIQRKFLQESQFELFLRQRLHIRKIHAEVLQKQFEREAFTLVSTRVAERRRILPFQTDGSVLKVGMSDPLDFKAIADLELNSGYRVVPYYVPVEELEVLLRWAQSGTRLGVAQSGTGLEAVETMLQHAAQMGCSDIHLEPKQAGYFVRFRVDGVMTEVDHVPHELGVQMVSRFKVMCSLDVTEKRRPQDGRARFETEDAQWALRVSTLPTLYGEKVVTRLLKQKETTHVDELGLDSSTIGSIQRVMQRQEGLFLVVGPTGSGKTTTLYAALNEIDATQRTVFTVEDPIEYEVPRYSQSQLAPDIGYNFGSALKALLRQDPDVILLGEMRDLESAEMAARIALTGCLVVSTMHSYDAISAVPRLTEIGVPSYVVNAVLSGVLAQRLVRRLCGQCKVETTPSEEQIRALDTSESLQTILERGNFFGPVGCNECHGLGYKGRFPVFEFLTISTELRQALRDQSPLEDMRKLALSQGYRPLRQNGLRRAMSGDTSVEELIRVL